MHQPDIHPVGNGQWKARTWRFGEPLDRAAAEPSQPAQLNGRSDRARIFQELPEQAIPPETVERDKSPNEMSGL